MRPVGKICPIVSAALLVIVSYAFAAEKSFTAVRFQGLKNVSKFDIIRDAGIKVSGEEIFADVDILKKSLERNALIESFSLDSEDGTLAVIVKEKAVTARAAAITANGTVPLILGEEFAVLAVSKTAVLVGPLFIVPGSEVTGNSMSPYFRRIYNLIKRTETEYPALYRELDEVKMRGERADSAEPDFLEIRLKGRPVLCRMTAEFQNLKRLNYIIGYMDASGRYPELLEIDGDSVVIR
jgi:phosphohistidine swiveling domain-containing protein